MDSFNSQSTPIYNRYLQGDFAVGTDNLNPLREIESDALQNLEDLRLRMYLQYKDKIKQLSGENTVETSEAVGLPYEIRTKVRTNVSLKDSMPQTDNPTGVEEDLYDTLKVLNTFFDKNLNDVTRALDAFLGGEPISFDELPFDICGDRSARSITTDEGASTSGSGAASVSSSPLVGSSRSGGGGATTEGSADAGSDLTCIMIELQYLQAIFAVLGFVKRIIALEQQVLAYVYPILELVTLIVSCILNPAARSQLIMMLVGQAMAVIIGFLTDMLSKLLGNLNLDCLLTSSMSSIQQIMGSVSTAKDIGSSAKSFVSFNKDLAASAKTGANLAVDFIKSPLSPTDELAAALGLTPDQMNQTPESIFKDSMKALSDGVSKGVSPVVTAAEGAAAAAAGGISGTVSATAKLVKDFFPDGSFAVY